MRVKCCGWGGGGRTGRCSGEAFALVHGGCARVDDLGQLRVTAHPRFLAMKKTKKQKESLSPGGSRHLPLTTAHTI